MKKNGATRMEKVDGGIFNGQCETGENWTLSDCSSKIIGARYYADAFLLDVPEEHRSPAEFISTRDGAGHGSHTASTAGGRIVDNVTVEGRKFGTVTGMAPGAALAIYKICWEDDDPDTGGCYTSSLARRDRRRRRRRRRRDQLLDLGRHGHRRGRRRGRLRGRGRGRRLRRHVGRQQRPRGVDRRAQQPVADHGRRVDALQLREHRGAGQRQEVRRRLDLGHGRPELAARVRR